MQTEWPVERYALIEVTSGLDDAAWHAAIEAHPLTQRLVLLTGAVPQPCVFCGTLTPRTATYLDALMEVDGRLLVGVYPVCAACGDREDYFDRLEEVYFQDAQAAGEKVATRMRGRDN